MKGKRTVAGEKGQRGKRPARGDADLAGEETLSRSEVGLVKVLRSNRERGA